MAAEGSVLQDVHMFVLLQCVMICPLGQFLGQFWKQFSIQHACVTLARHQPKHMLREESAAGANVKIKGLKDVTLCEWA